MAITLTERAADHISRMAVGDPRAGVERRVEAAAAVAVLDAVERRVRRARDAGREVDAGDEAHRARGERAGG